MQCACAILSSLACPALQYFSTLSHKRHDFRKRIADNKMCVFIFFTQLSDTLLILRRNERDIIEMYIGLHVKCPLFLSHFNETIFATDFRNIFKYNISWKSVQWEPSCSTRTGRQTCRNFANVPKKASVQLRQLCQYSFQQNTMQPGLKFLQGIRLLFFVTTSRMTLSTHSSSNPTITRSNAGEARS